MISSLVHDLHLAIMALYFGWALLFCGGFTYICRMSTPTLIQLNPGPVMVPAFVMEAIAQPVVHQRTAAFDAFFESLQGDLQYVFQTTAPVIAMPGTGTFGVEAAIFSFFQAGDQVAIPAMGKFSQRWVAFALDLGLDVVPIGLSWGHTFTVAHAQSVLEEYPRLKGWVLTHVETSTGVAIDLEEIAAAIKQAAPRQLIVVDAICSVGIQALYTDDWQLDVVVAASQKGFLNPAGTVFVAVGPLAAAGLVFPDAADYRHLGHYYRYLMHGSYPFTPPTQFLYGVQAALRRMREETMPVVWNRTHAMSRYFKQAAVAMGATLFGDGSADALTVLSFGRGGHDRIRERLVLEHGIEVAGGQDQLEDLILRVGHFGPVALPEMEACIAGLKHVTAKEGK
jgi:aspartate aminotransferase-like enzyme